MFGCPKRHTDALLAKTMLTHVEPEFYHLNALKTGVYV